MTTIQTLEQQIREQMIAYEKAVREEYVTYARGLFEEAGITEPVRFFKLEEATQQALIGQLRDAAITQLLRNKSGWSGNTAYVNNSLEAIRRGVAEEIVQSPVSTLMEALR